MHETCVCVAQAPAPLHDAAASSVPDEQLCAAQVAVEKVHVALVPSHRPWQTPEPAHAARDPCGCPAVGSVVQMPCCPLTSHAWQLPAQGLSQQKESTHWLLVHWAFDVQGEPLDTVPHDPFTHGLPTQSLLVEHVVAQASPLGAQLKGAHDTAVLATQCPCPSQAEPATAALVPASHDPPPQAVPLAQSSQLPAPSHLPSSPHVPASLVAQGA